MNREAAIEAGQDEILVNWSIWVTSRKAARNIAAAVIDAAAPHLVGEPIGWAEIGPDGTLWRDPRDIARLTPEARNSLRRVALVPISEDER